MDEAITATLKASDEKVYNIPCGRIYPNPKQPRKHFDPVKLRELASSIKVRGLLQPITVVPHPTIRGAFLLVAGERRLRAHQLAGISVIPCIVRDDGSDDQWKLSFVENYLREDLTTMEQARAYRRCVDEYGMTVREIKELIGVSEPKITGYLKLLELPEEVQRAIDDGALSIDRGLNLAQYDGKEGGLLRFARRLIAGDETAVIELERIGTSDFGERVSLGRQPKTPEGMFYQVLKLHGKTRYTGRAIRRFAELPVEEARRLWHTLDDEKRRLFALHIGHLAEDVALLARHLKVLDKEEGKGSPPPPRTERKKAPPPSAPPPLPPPPSPGDPAEPDFARMSGLLSVLLYSDADRDQKRVRLSYGLARRYLGGTMAQSAVYDAVIAALREVERNWGKGVPPKASPAATSFCAFTARVRRDFGNHTHFSQFMSALVSADRASDAISLSVLFPAPAKGARAAN